MPEEFRFKGKKVTVANDGHVFVNGSSAGIKQWKSDPKRFSSLIGAEQKNLKGKSLEDALKMLGLIPR